MPDLSVNRVWLLITAFTHLSHGYASHSMRVFFLNCEAKYYIYIYNISSAPFGSWDKTPQKNVHQPLAQLTADKQKKTFIFYVYLISFYVSFLKLLAFNLIIYKARQLPQVTLSCEVKNFIFQKEIQVFNISKKYNIFWSPSKCNFSFCKPTC